MLNPFSTLVDALLDLGFRAARPLKRTASLRLPLPCPESRTWRSRRWLRLALLSVPVTLASAPAVHAEEDPRGAARQHFARGVELANAEAYAEAVVEFTKAYELRPHYSVLYNIGQAYVALGDSVRAFDALSRYLNEGGANITDERRRATEAELAQQRSRIAELEVEANVSGATVSVDDEPAGKTPLSRPVRVVAGSHRVRAVAEGGRSQEQVIAVTGGQRHRLVLSLPPIVGAVPITAPSAPERSAEQRFGAAPTSRERASEELTTRSARATLGYVIAGLGLASGGAAFGHFLWNKGRYDRWSSRHAELQDNPDDERQDRNNELARSIERASVVSVALGIGAGVAVGTGSILIFTAPSASASRAPQSSYRMLVWRGVF